MFAGTSREQTRRIFLEAWRKFSSQAPLQPFEAQIAAVIAEHPEYLPLIESGESAVAADLQGHNPFLHMGLHLAIREQVATDRPAGIRAIHESLAQRHGGALAGEHAMIDVLAEALWQAQRDNRMPDEPAYLEKLRQLT